ncbi:MULTISPECIES: hypothetical protein [unclassified Bradyrhizobium]|uniref:hypothetical protein n=1 Tax=unclassified Bradyrhizobium TaxID=2631580 RepID=UPI001FFA5181|nr:MULTISPECIES: hypothetical protein [unclassified Bradyrhizobium]MCK1540349.1 hypothetical protein [Bradyrhizobium sp. 176]MCK1556191.1 hypothetical protein [Bradyrhizobium sp. 171]
MKARLITELDAHKADLESQLAQRAAQRLAVSSGMDGAIQAARARELNLQPHEGLILDLLTEGEFV